jgi:hypothetical protein
MAKSDLRLLLFEAKGAAAVVPVLRELLRKHWKDEDLPMPDIKLVNRARASYLARCVWRKGGTNTLFEVQRRIMGDPKTLRRVMAHELIHHWEFLRTDQTRALALQSLGIRSDGHGPAFMQQAQRINSMEGSDYVTKDSDETYDTSTVPPFYILVQPHKGSHSVFGYTTALRPSKNQKVIIADKMAKYQARLFRITDGQFFAGSYPIKKYGGYGLPHDKDKQLALAKLYNSGHQIVL